MSKFSVYEMVTNRIIKQLEEGKIAWENPLARQQNLVSGHVYKGINTLILGCAGSSYFATFKQIKEMGGTLKKGSESFPITFWNIISKKKDEAEGEEEEKKFFFLRYYNVFRAEDIENLPEKYQKKLSEKDNADIISAEDIISRYQEPTYVETSGGKCFYRSTEDTINMPSKGKFKNSREYYSTLFHEMAHSTGHQTRLNRKLGNPFGSPDYAREELIAELSASFLMAETGEELYIKNHTAYIQSWLKALNDDVKLIFTASKQAEKSVNYILAKDVEPTEPKPTKKTKETKKKEEVKKPIKKAKAVKTVGLIQAIKKIKPLTVKVKDKVCLVSGSEGYVRFGTELSDGEYNLERFLIGVYKLDSEEVESLIDFKFDESVTVEDVAVLKLHNKGYTLDMAYSVSKYFYVDKDSGKTYITNGQKLSGNIENLRQTKQLVFTSLPRKIIPFMTDNTIRHNQTWCSVSNKEYEVIVTMDTYMPPNLQKVVPKRQGTQYITLPSKSSIVIEALQMFAKKKQKATLVFNNDMVYARQRDETISMEIDNCLTYDVTLSDKVVKELLSMNLGGTRLYTTESLAPLEGVDVLCMPMKNK